MSLSPEANCDSDQPWKERSCQGLTVLHLFSFELEEIFEFARV